MDDLISRQAAIDALDAILPVEPMKNEYTQGITCGAALAIEYVKQLPSAHPEKRTEERTETHACDCISRKDAIRWIKTECNPYGKPTLDFESGKRVMKHLEQMPPAQPEWIPVMDGDGVLPEVDEDGYSDYVLVSFSNVSGLDIGQYREDENGGAFYSGDDDDPYTKIGVFVNAWMPLPKPYKEEGEKDGKDT